jgi:hypothetical protein
MDPAVWRVLRSVLCAGLYVFSAATAFASCFAISQPASGVEVTPGLPFTVTWTSCAGVSAVDIYLVDLDGYVALSNLVTATPNNGTASVSFPTTNLPCNRRYVLMMRDAAVFSNESWGPGFTVKCDIRVTKQGKPGNYKITVTNNGTNPIIPLINPTALQKRSVPVFSFSDTLPNGVTLTSVSGQTGAGVWTLPTLPITGPQTFLFEFRLNQQVVIPGGQNAPIASITINAAKPVNCLSETTHRSDNLNTGILGTIADYKPANNVNQCAP